MKLFIPFFILIITHSHSRAISNDTLVLRINFIFIQKSDGTGNFIKEDSLQNDYLNKAVERLNDLISLKLKTVPRSDCISNHTLNDSGIRFRLNKILEVKNDSLWDNEQDRNYKHCPDRRRWYLLKTQQILDSLLEPEDQGINIYFTVSAKHHDYVINAVDTIEERFPQFACSMFPSKYLKDFSVVHFPNSYLKYLFMKQFPYEWGYGTLGRGLAHELGHSLGLQHVKTCGNIMDGKGTTNRKNLTDSQIELARKNILSTNLSRYLDH